MTTFMMLPILNSAADSSVLTEEVAAMRYSWHMMIEMLVANGNLLTMHAQSQHMIGVSKRICTLLDGLDQIQTDRAEMQATTMLEGQKIKFEKAEIWTPMQRNTKQKKLLVRDLSFELNHGSSLLLTGHNGAGKSSIFRVLGGLWTTPTGTITKPGAGLAGTALSRDIFYLPQKPYNVLGSLRANITYPMDPVRTPTLQRPPAFGHSARDPDGWCHSPGFRATPSSVPLSGRQRCYRRFNIDVRSSI